MADEWQARLAALYTDDGVDRDVLDDSLDPLGPDVLFDLAGELGARPGALVVDIGARDGKQLTELRERFGCDAFGVEPTGVNIARRTTDAMVQACAERLPLRDGVADLLWVRDVLVHVTDLPAAFAEMRRVAKPGAPVLVFAVFATDRLTAEESAELCEPLAIVPANLSRSTFEDAVASAGLGIERHVRLDGQWREYGESHDEGRTSRQLLRVARMRRDPARYRALLGDDDYAAELADSLYGVYQLLGKLSASIDVLR